MPSSHIARDSYYYSVLEDNKRISDDWSIFQNLFVAVLIISIICVWFESSSEEIPESDDNPTTSEDASRLLTTSVSTQSENFETPSYPNFQNIENADEVGYTFNPPSRPTTRSILRCPNESDESAYQTAPRQLFATPTTLQNGQRGCCSTKPKSKLRRNLRFLDPETSESTPQLRRSSRLNPPQNQTNETPKLNSTELLYCQEWCRKHQRKQNRRKSKSRSRSRSRSSSRSRSRSKKRSPRLKRKPR